MTCRTSATILVLVISSVIKSVYIIDDYTDENPLVVIHRWILLIDRDN